MSAAELSCGGECLELERRERTVSGDELHLLAIPGRGVAAHAG